MGSGSRQTSPARGSKECSMWVTLQRCLSLPVEGPEGEKISLGQLICRQLKLIGEMKPRHGTKAIKCNPRSCLTLLLFGHFKTGLEMDPHGTRNGEQLSVAFSISRWSDPSSPDTFSLPFGCCSLCRFPGRNEDSIWRLTIPPNSACEVMHSSCLLESISSFCLSSGNPSIEYCLRFGLHATEFFLPCFYYLLLQ